VTACCPPGQHETGALRQGGFRHFGTSCAYNLGRTTREASGAFHPLRMMSAADPLVIEAAGAGEDWFMLTCLEA